MKEGTPCQSERMKNRLVQGSALLRLTSIIVLSCVNDMQFELTEAKRRFCASTIFFEVRLESERKAQRNSSASFDEISSRDELVVVVVGPRLVRPDSFVVRDLLGVELMSLRIV